jgi:nickel/cobalt transporter (NiCoT) family protein
MALCSPLAPPEASSARPARRQLLGMAAAVGGLLVAGSLLLVLGTRGHHGSLSIASGLLALTLGMRHAFDADHLAAIDNVTRRLMGRGERPLSAGFWFSLGHSTVVLALTVLLMVGVHGLGASVSDPSSGLHLVTGVLGTSISAAFLLAIAVANLAVLRSLRASLRAAKAGVPVATGEAPLPGGPLSRLLAPLMRRVDAPGKMYPLGLAFGLGFDTATEVGLLVLSATAAASGMSVAAMLSLPLLFAGGMSLLDSLDGCAMNLAYGWALTEPQRRLRYNVVVTGLSVAIAAVIGSLEVAGLLIDHLGLRGGAFRLIGGVDLTVAGFVIVGLFAVVLGAAVLWQHLARSERSLPAEHRA